MISTLALFGLLQAGAGVLEYHLVPERHYGSADGPLAFSDIADLAVAGGILFVTQPRSGEVAIINVADGKLIRTTRRGEGPGEFRVPVDAGTKGDTVWIQDGSLGRISLFNSQGAFLRTIPFPSRHTAVGLTTDGAILGQRNPHNGGSTPLLRFSRSTQAIDTLLQMPQTSPVVMDARAPNGPTIRFLNPFAQVPIAQLDSDGRTAIVVTMDGEPGREIQIQRVLGDRRTAVRVRYPPQRVQMEDLERFTQSFPPALRTRGAIERMRFPSSWVPVNRVEVARNGDVWLGSDISGKPVAWTIVNRTGQIVGKLQSPVASKLHFIDGDVVWGSEIGVYNVPMVVRYRLERK
jgi:hypothetical protein